MAESKRTHRIAPCFSYDITGMESWLEEMAAKGMVMEQDGYFVGIFTFVKGEPKALRFRLEPAPTERFGPFTVLSGVDQEHIALLKEMGWHYRGDWGRFIIYISDAPDAPELHTDPRVQALTLKALTRYLWGYFGWMLFYFVIWMGIIMNFPFFQIMAVLGLSFTLVLTALALSEIGLQAYHLIHVLGLKRQLENGIPLSHKSDYRRRSGTRYTLLAAQWIGWIYIMVFLALFSDTSFSGEKEVPLEDWADPLPFVQLEDLFPEEDHPSTGSVLHWENGFCPDAYRLSQDMHITMPGGSDNLISLNVSYYQTNWEWVAKGLARELVKEGAGTRWHREQNVWGRLEALPGIDADYAMVYDGGFHTGVVLQKGSTVIQVNCSRLLYQFHTPEELAKLAAASLP